MEIFQHDLAEQITNEHSVWSALLANTNFGNYASSLWNVTLIPEHVTINRDEKTLTFKNAKFICDVNSGISYGDDVSIFTKHVSGKGSYQFRDCKTIQLTELTIVA
ncbi:hypothetical protein ACFSSB_02880 [Lacinutrix gracilariae]|uniref:Uncharacterized protein n=1 Tax=Lacinutrix gracilariae TaxID=1747198 RepID=A0ABW5K0C5_9FLAO